MDETSQGSVELLDSVDMVSAHVEKLGAGMREEDLHSPYTMELHRVPGGSPSGQLLTSDLITGNIHPHIVEEFSTHGVQEYYEHHILQEHELSDPDRHLAELQHAVVDEPQNLSAPVTVVGDKPGIAAMVSAYIHTTSSDNPQTQIIIDTTGKRGSELFHQDRLPSLASLHPHKKVLTSSSIRSRYLRPSQTHHSLEEEVALSPMSGSHVVSSDGTNVIVVDGQHMLSEDQRLLDAGHSILAEDGITHKLLQDSSNVNHRILAHENQRLIVAQDATTIAHSIATSAGTHRLVNSMNGHHRTLDVQSDQNTRFLTHQEASVVTSMASQRLLNSQAQQAQAQVQTQAELDVAERLLDEESPEHQMLVQEQLIHVVLDQETQEQLGPLVTAPGQRVLVQGPGGQWTEIDTASCEPDTGDHDSRDTTMGDITEQEENLRTSLIVKHEEVELVDGLAEDGMVDGMEGIVEGMGDVVADGSDGELPVDDMNDSDYDVEGDIRSSKRSLPHKKRLSRKLRNPRKTQPLPRSIHAKCYKCNKCDEQFGTQAAYALHKITHTAGSKKAPAFSCEICGKVIPNQLKFFEHLKVHYEPRPGGGQINSASQSDVGSIENGTSFPRASVTRTTRDKNDAQAVMKDDQQKRQDVLKQLQKHPQQHQHNQHHQPPPHPSHQQQLVQHQQRIEIHHLQQQQQQQQQHEQQQRHLQGQQQGDIQHIILKAEDVMPVINKPQEELQIHQQNLQQLHQMQSQQRQRHVKHEQDPLQLVTTQLSPQQHTQQQRHHQSAQQQHHHSSHHQTLHHQTAMQQSVINSEPPPLVPILPPVSTITGPVSLTCNLCGKHFRRQKTYETHMSVAHPKQEDIEQFSDPEDMMEGIRGVVEAGEESGDEADSLVLTSLTPHSTLSKGHAETWYRDEDLSATEADLQALQHAENEQQQQQHAQQQQAQQAQAELTYMCELCGDAFQSKTRLNQHVREEHLELRQKVGKKDVEEEPADSAKAKKVLRRLACPQCDRVFNHRNSLVYHLRSHSGERPHQCEECGKSFFATSALKVHMRLHSGDKPYKCEFCGRSFRQWGDLKYHCTSRHSEEKQYHCEYCGKDFARKYSLIVHRRIHTGEKNYVCEFCSKQFRASSYLQNHRRIHTGEKPHRCEVCSKPFRVRSDMKRHLNTHNRDRQRIGNSNSASVTTGGSSGSIRGVHHKIEAPDPEPDVENHESGDHLQAVHNITLHELDNSGTLGVVKRDAEVIETILPDPGPGCETSSAQTSTTLSLSTHNTDDGLQYVSARDPLDTSRTHGSSHSATALYVWPVYMT